MAELFADNKKTLDKALQNQALQVAEKETQRRAVSGGFPYVDLTTFPVDLMVLGLFTKAEIEQCQTTPFYLDQKILRLATVNPTNAALRAKISELSKRYTVQVYYISQHSLNHAIRLSEKVAQPKDRQDTTVRLPQELKENYIAQLGSVQGFTEQSASLMMEQLLGAALQFNSSDIHLEPEERGLRVRVRVDGVLQDVSILPSTTQHSLIGRLKIMAGLKFNITTEPQDGRFTFYQGNEAIDVRVSVLPSVYGESAVLRLLGVGATNLGVEELGLRGSAAETIRFALHQPNGMIVTTGPTGSGKTTTLYAFLKELNRPGVKIITLEDPVEYKLPGIQQTQITHEHNFSFATGLRSILRQDPDVVMVGEIRDAETANTALQAALTGHIVLSTLHTNDSAGAVPRLQAMGVESYVIAPALNAIIAQRLVRRLCAACKVVSPLEAALQNHAQAIITAIPAAAGLTVPNQFTFYTAPGCEACNGLGYRGRIGIYEVVRVTDDYRNLILKQVPGSELAAYAKSQGTITMLQDGLLKALEGITDVAEVMRVAGEF